MNQNETTQNQYIVSVRAENARYEAEYGVPRRAFALTLGCQQNEADSEKLLGMARAMGYTVTKEAKEASLILVNTCAIREHAEQRALSLVGQYKHLKEKNPDLILVLCGCMAAESHRIEQIKKSYPYVDILFGTASLHRLPELLLQRLQKRRRILISDNSDLTVAEGIPVYRESNYRAWVSIMYGCNNFCSYCIVPYVRGRERSRQKAAIVQEVRELVRAGYRDITLLGQNVNSYGKDLEDRPDFADLLSELDAIEGDYLLHFMTSHPKDATKKLIDVMAASRHVAHHFHLPMQSGSDSILKAMNRRYDFEKYIGIVDYLREKMPDVVITSDIIVGFPGETEEDFEDTLRALRRARFDMIYSFIYSPRKGTPAAEMECQIPPEIQGERMDRLLALQNEIAQSAAEPYLGKTVRILCDGPSKNNDAMFSGRTEGGKLVFFEGVPEDTGCFLLVEIERAEAFALYGRKK